MDYYHDSKMESLFKKLKQPRTLDELQLSKTFVKDLILKMISNYGTVKSSIINEVTGIHWDIMEVILSELEKNGYCAPVSGGFLFSSIQYTITKKGREKIQGISEENPYIGMAPVSYEQYFEMMESQIKNRYPIKIPSEVVDVTFNEVVGVEFAKQALIEACTIGKGIFMV